MFKIVNKKMLNPTVCEMDIEAPLVARKADAGQFIILRVDEKGERIPLTVAGYDREKGLVKIIFQVVGASTKQLEMKNKGDYIEIDDVLDLGEAKSIGKIYAEEIDKLEGREEKWKKLNKKSFHNAISFSHFSRLFKPIQA